MFKKKKFIKIFAIIIVLVIIILVIGKKKGWVGKKENIKVSTELVTKRSIVEIVSANGKIEPELEVKISPDVSGEVIELYVKEGNEVQAGDLLAKINRDIYETAVDRMIAAVNNSKAAISNAKARLAQANAQFTNAKSIFDRNEKLWNQQAISASEYDASKSAFFVAKAEVEAAEQTVKSSEYNVTSAEASLKESKDNLNKTTIFAPVSGTISKLSIEKGERVVGTTQFTGTELMRISNLNEMEVKVQVNENDIIRVHYNDTALIEVDAYQNRKFKGIVTEIASSASSSTTTSVDQVTNFDVKIRILRDSYKDLLDAKNPNLSPFKPGMSASVDIQTKRAINVLTVPVQAVTIRVDSTKLKIAIKESKKENTTNQNGEEKVDKKVKTQEFDEYVFVYENGSVKLQKIKIGIQDNTYIEITEGLKEKQEIITAPYRAVSKELKDGDKVKKVNKNELFGK